MFSTSLLLASSLAAAALAQTSTMNLFLGGQGSNEQWAASVVKADCHATTLALVCTSGSYQDFEGQTTTCNSDLTATATYSGSSFFEISTSVSTSGVEVQIVETCKLSGTTKAACSASISVSAEGTSTSTSTSTTSSTVASSAVPITAAASKLPATSSCSSKNAAATGMVDMVKVVVVPGAAALLAGAAVL